MKLRDLRWKLAAHLRLGAQYPDLAAIASKAQQQSNSPLMLLPAEIRNAIIQELLHDAGVSQHIIFQRGRYVRARCVTDHAASDDLMDDCRNFRASRFDDTLMFQRPLSPWGNHWKCEELYKSTRHIQSSPFLSIMLACSQLYVSPLSRLNSCHNLLLGISMFAHFSITLSLLSYMIFRPCITLLLPALLLCSAI